MFLAVLAILAAVALSSTVFYSFLRREVVEGLESCAIVMMEADAWRMVSDPEDAVIDDMPEELKQMRITVVDREGRALCDSSADVSGMENHRNRPEISQALSEGKGQAIRNSETLGKSAFYYAVRMENGNVLRVSRDVSSMTGILMNTAPLLVVLSLLLFLLCILLSHVLTKSIVRPIEELAGDPDGFGTVQVYEEMKPYVNTIRRQREDIIRNADLRQEFTANVSHELKTPLTAISGYAELIANGIAAGDDIQRFAREIHKSSNRLLVLINDIIRLSELDVTTDIAFEQVDLYRMAADCLGMLQMMAEKHDVSLAVSGQTQYVTANRQMMEEMIYNFCDNAIRYNNKGGRVDVAVYRRGGEVFLEVEDNGIGIPSEEQERIFERFYRVDKSRSKSTGGTGLGLAIVKHIIARHENAHLELQSELGKGTTIRVCFADIPTIAAGKDH